MKDVLKVLAFDSETVLLKNLEHLRYLFNFVYLNVQKCRKNIYIVCKNM